MRAILFSNFPKDVHENTLKPKFDQYGIDILKVVRIDRTEAVDCSQADVLIAMIELMSGGQRQKVKELARRHNKKFVALYRKGAVWEKSLVEMVQKFREEEERKRAPLSVKAVGVMSGRLSSTRPNLSVVPVAEPEPPPAILEPEPPEPTTEELQALLQMFEAENEKLEDQKDELVERLKKSDGLASALEKQLETAKKSTKTLESRSELLEKQLESARGDDEYFNSLVGQNDNLRKEIDSIRAELTQTQDEVYALKKELAASSTKKQESILEQALEPMKQLWKLGYLTPEDICKKLFKEK